jgi:tetratricopeptide (TPR) repeat protein
MMGLALASCAAPETTGPSAADELADRTSTLQAMSLLGRPLYTPLLDGARAPALIANLEAAQRAYDRNPNDEMTTIWLGRRLGYVGRYKEAIAVCTDGLKRFPESARLRRHRGHRYITVRRFYHAIDDLKQATDLIAGVPDEIEEDGAPNALNIPRGTTHFNVWYHLGLAYYLTGDFEPAANAYATCMTFCRNDDTLVATTYWSYLTLRRLGRTAEAAALLDAVDADMEIIENHAYHALLLLFRGDRTAEELLDDAATSLDRATITYGVAGWHLVHGREAEAVELLSNLLAGDEWAAFGFIAAEADFKRLRGRPIGRPSSG